MRGRLKLLALLLLLAVAGTSALVWSRGHMRRMSGREDLAGVSCSSCHGRGAAAFTWDAVHPRHPMPAGLVVSADGSLLYVACSGNDEVLALDTVTGEPQARVAVEGAPFGLALDADNGRLLVACRDAKRVVSLDARTLEVRESLDVGRDPTALLVVQRPGGGAPRVVVTNTGSDDVSLLETAPLRQLTRLATGRQPFAVAAAGAAVIVANRLARTASPEDTPVSEATLIDPWRPAVLARPQLHSAHMSEGVAVLPDGARALVPVVRIRNLVPITQVAGGWVMTSALAICDLAADAVTQVPLDDAGACYADPSAVVVDPAGARAYVAAGGAEVVSVIDLALLERSLADLKGEEARARAGDDLQLASDYVVARIPTGPNPRHLALAPDGSTLYVAEHLGDAILAVDTASGKARARWSLRGRSGDDPVWRGARIFAAARTSFHGQFSCRSCHPDGHVDGLAYDFDIDGLGRNIVDNRSLRGVGGSAPFKWNGKNASLEVQCGLRFAKVLTRTEAISGRELQDLATYIRSLPPMPPDRGGSEAARERGRRLFFASHAPDGREIPPGQRCSTCHPPPLYTNGLASSVGSGGPGDDHEAFDVPHLLGIAASPPYLHDGRAATLEEIWTVYNPDDTHGITNGFSKHDLNDLMEFLRSL